MEAKQALAQKLDQEPFRQMQVLAGFDAFVDNILHLVAERQDLDHYQRVQTIAQCAERIAAASGKSANLELVRQQRKAGGNAPHFSICASTLGANVTTIAPVGDAAVLPVFHEAAPKVHWLSIGDPGNTDALEFQDGKLMLGQIGDVGAIGWEIVRNRVGEDHFFDLLQQSQLALFGNWTMLLGMGSLFEAIANHLHNHPGVIFIDLADPRKRSREDLLHALQQITHIGQNARVVLGLNRSEAEQILDVLGQEKHSVEEDSSSLQTASEHITQNLQIAGVVIHALHGAAGCWQGETRYVEGPYCVEPRISTGAGDHFNGGCATALGAGFSLEESLLCGVTSSGYYVRHAHAATAKKMAQFLVNWTEK
ncbi:MAG TPA: PfkB family carbohydrate kinase [Fibrobacteraceae bacterium]|nr:PfkB family carbohydrate kinase [Fibrobacteraceae bacterium]